jgi:hypothetical protein
MPATITRNRISAGAVGFTIPTEENTSTSLMDSVPDEVVDIDAFAPLNGVLAERKRSLVVRANNDGPAVPSLVQSRRSTRAPIRRNIPTIRYTPFRPSVPVLLAVYMRYNVIPLSAHMWLQHAGCGC